LESKIGAITKSMTGNNIFKKRPDMRRFIIELTSIRDKFIHYKHEYFQIVELDKKRVSEIYKIVNPVFLKEVLINIRRIIRFINEHIEWPSPYWLEKQVDWLEDIDPKDLLS
jgi:transcriptional antiterminator